MTPTACTPVGHVYARTPLGNGWMTSRAWARHCRRTFPFTTKERDDTIAALARLQQEVGVKRGAMAWAMRQGYARQAAGHRRVLAQRLDAIRAGEAHLRALDALPQ